MRLGGIVWKMRIVVVSPKKEALPVALLPIEPLQRAARDHFTAHFGDNSGELVRGFLILHLVVVGRKATIQAIAAVKDGGADKGSSLESRGSEGRGQRRDVSIENKPSHVTQLVLLGISSCQDGTVRRRSERHLSARLGGTHAARGKSI